jgi:hypothetical protein
VSEVSERGAPIVRAGQLGVTARHERLLLLAAIVASDGYEDLILQNQPGLGDKVFAAQEVAQLCGPDLSCCAADLCDTLPVALRFRLQSNPFVGKLATKYLLPLGTRQVGDDVVFFNFGYEEDPPMALPLAASDEPNRYGIQVYHLTASQVDLTGKRVLEVSCGAGGGGSYIVRTLRPASYTGLDLNPASIDLCRKRHKLPGLEFVQGDAENLPFPDQYFDAVINVEASHQYPHFRRFLAEVARVLRPDGHFLYTDSRRHSAIAEWETALADAPMRQIAERNIVDEAMRGLAANTPAVGRAAQAPHAAVPTRRSPLWCQHVGP